MIRYLKEKSNAAFPVIGVGGIMSVQDAIEKLEAGADLLQIYTGFIYEGPGLIKKININGFWVVKKQIVVSIYLKIREENCLFFKLIKNT